MTACPRPHEGVFFTCVPKKIIKVTLFWGYGHDVPVKKEFHMVKCCEEEFIIPLIGKQIRMLLNFKGSVQEETSQVSFSLAEGFYSQP